jgi:hypothetical protein
MEKFIGRIRLSKEDSEEWSSHPPFMYVVEKGDRANVNNAVKFNDKNSCYKALVNDFEHYHHLPSSKMEIITLNVEVKKIEEISHANS